MSIETRAAEILRETEAGLRNLAAEAVSVGDYAGTLQVAAWAKAVSDLLPRSGSLPGKLHITARGRGSKEDTRHRSGARPAARRIEQQYPRFLRDGDELIRVAWSKREKAEYQQKASHGALRALTVALMTAGKDGRVFSTDKLLPLHNPVDGTEIPNYQSYVCIAWLKQTGLIDQHGRQGYSVPRLDEFQHAVQSLWDALPKRTSKTEKP